MSNPTSGNPTSDNPTSGNLVIKEIADVPGLFYIENIITPEYEQVLLEHLDKLEWKPLSTAVNSRKVQHYGYLYDYNNYSVAKAPDDIPEFMEKLKELLIKVCNEKNIVDVGYVFNQCIVNNYNQGQGISKHIDLKTFGKVIGCFTIMGGATMRFSLGSKKYDIYTKPKSLYIMSGEARYKWMHEMTTTKKDIINDEKMERKRRISITFRNVPISK